MAKRKTGDRKNPVRMKLGKSSVAKTGSHARRGKASASHHAGSQAPLPFDLSFLLAGASGLWAGYCYQTFQDLVSAAFFGVLAVGLALRGVYPKWRYEKGAQKSFSWIHFIAGITAETFGVLAFCRNPPFWRIGIPLQLFAFWSLWLSLPPKAEVFVTPLQTPLKRPAKQLSEDHFRLLLTLIVVAQAFLFQLQNVIGMLVTGVVVIGIWVIRFKWGESAPESPMPAKQEKLWLLLILILAAVLRLPFMGANVVGLQNDEANMIMDVMNVLNGVITDPFGVGWGATAALPYYITAVFYKLLGAHLWVARFVSVLGCFLGIYMLFKLCRLFFSSAASLLAAYFFAVSWWTLFHSLSPFNGIFTVLYCICGLYFLELGFREGKRLHFWWAGIFAALSLDTYVPGRLVPPMMFIAVLGALLFGREHFIKAYWKQILVTLAAFMWLFGPTLWVCMVSPDVVTGRAGELNIFKVAAESHKWWLPIENFGRAFLALVQDPGVGNDLRFDPAGNPMLDPFMSLFLIGGLALSIAGLGRRLSWIILPGLLISLTATAFAQTRPELGYFSAIRCYLVLPFALMMVARFIDWLQALEITKRLPRAVWRGALALMVLGSLVFNVHAYFFGWPVGQGQWEQMGFNHLLLSKQVNLYGPKRQMFIFIEDWSNPARIMSKENYPVAEFNDSTALPILYKVDKDVVFIFSPWQCLNFQKRLKDVYPNAVWKNVPDQYQSSYFEAVEISKDDYLNAQAGKGLPDPPPDGPIH